MDNERGDIQRQVRLAIYAHIVSTGRGPSPEEIAAAERLSEADVVTAMRALADAHVIVLTPGRQLWSAPPFSAVPTSFRANGPTGSWHAPCAWDMFGIPAALKCDAELDARCAWSGAPLPCAIRNGRATGTGLIHLEVPAQRFWDDIFYT